MIIARLWGGLGNQLFQYAAGYALAKACRTALLLDPTQCHLDQNRPYELEQFNITGRPWTEAEKKRLGPLIRLVRPAEETTKHWSRMVKQLLLPVVSRHFYYVADRNAGFQSEIFTRHAHAYMAGTWADSRYFAADSDDILRQFSFKAAPDDENRRMLELIGKGRAVCVHVRRGDYVKIADTIARFGVCSSEYYHAAMAHVLARVENPTAFVFSDDPVWTAEHLRLPCETVYVTHNVGRCNAEDLRLMAACQHFVIANSTFSWWGAWLSTHPEKIVVAPKRWSIDTQTIGNPVLPDWVKI